MCKYKIAVIAMWFGKLPPYFPVWLMSTEKNKDVDFFFFSDQDVVSNAPNVYMIKTNLRHEVDRISEKTGEIINIQSAYKFCDLRPFFGIAYQDDYLKNYDFWGYCDIDLAFGNIRKFLTDEKLESYERFYEWGHFSLFRNNEKMNHLYYLPGSLYSLDETLCGFEKVNSEEHHGLNRICVQNGIKWYRSEDFADFWTCYSDLILWHGQKNYDYQLFYWENGQVFRAYLDTDEKVKTNEYVYIHWQKRVPIIDEQFDLSNPFFITSEKFINKEAGIPSQDIIREIGKSESDISRKKERYIYLTKKSKEFLAAPVARKKIWLRQKMCCIREEGYLIQR